MPQSLNKVVEVLDDVAPIAFAEDWDNVGLLVAPPGRGRVQRALLTIDLTQAVFDEARRKRADLIVAYHPPIFAPLSELSADVAMQRLVMQCVQARIAVYSPHTALDAVEGGVNDWLCDGLGAGERAPLLRQEWHEAAPPGVGQGREVVLDRPVSLQTVARRVKKHLGLKHLRVATPAGQRAGATVRRIAVCVGSGGSVVGGREADLYLTGEMGHHEVLAATAQGASVLLCEHSNSERGYLPTLARALRRRFGRAVSVVVSARDAEPLRVC